VLNKDLRSSKRRANKLGRELESLKDQASGLDAAQFGLEWLIDNGGQSDKIPWSEVVVVGSVPFDETDLTNFLIDRGVDVYDTNTEGVPCMIVGRDGWTEEKLEMQIAAQQGLELRVYSQEMALFALAAGTDMFDMADQDTLEELAGEHPALEFLREGELQWPLFAVPSIPKEFNPELWNIGDVDQSPLKAMGYTVGITEGISRKARKDLLARAYLGSLTPVHSAEYMRDWGRPRTRRRLWRIANHLAWLARARKRNPSQRYAVADWVTDLEMIEKRFFKPWMRFAWPRVKVPGRR